MADNDRSRQTAGVYTNDSPLPKFYFSVTFGDIKASFQEVAGLESETTDKVGSVTFRKGVFITDPGLAAWLDPSQMKTIVPQTVVITLLDETGTPKMAWTLGNAYATKADGADLKSEGNEIAVESLEIAYQTLVISAGG